ncbi:hypothetical protein [Alicyclobacillus macrosporangiidus]|uniref:Uncharacterized protein n=1 Tax=Alicyclobacillus macrosporangiidus TaxID=392015 RepID=A0A1I7GY35_9BACL|nr:hypothetical protein [Alicyclobacillus macrosporangiidus]SFU53351.1 hypothetical protein SAMN05421543_103126 [Alicyclobacillus macrosporangiidus]
MIALKGGTAAVTWAICGILMLIFIPVLGIPLGISSSLVALYVGIVGLLDGHRGNVLGVILSVIGLILSTIYTGLFRVI